MSEPTYRLLLGDCLDVLRTLPDASVDAVVTDPPYELAFMGKAWDAQGVAFNVSVWHECWRVLKPGGHLLAFGGTRTHHRIWCAVEDAGFEVRDTLQWLYGSGFPKSLNVGKAVDKTFGAERAVTGERVSAFGDAATSDTDDGRNLWGKPATTVVPLRDAPATDAARQWDGWGTALKPAHEPVVLARKPLDGTVAANVLRWGTGGINVDGCRVGTEPAFTERKGQKSSGGLLNVVDGERVTSGGSGRWPPNVLLTCCGQVPHAEGCAAGELDRQSGASTGAHGRAAKDYPRGGMHDGGIRLASKAVDRDTGGASRFFPTFRYEPKASRSERNAGLDREPTHIRHRVNAAGMERDPKWAPVEAKNHHPTVKPVALMRWLCRLVTPPGGTVLDPFAGSGTTGVAALAEGFGFVGVEREPEYHAIATARLDHAADKARPADLFAWAETAGG